MLSPLLKNIGKILVKKRKEINGVMKKCLMNKLNVILIDIQISTLIWKSILLTKQPETIILDGVSSRQDTHIVENLSPHIKPSATLIDIQIFRELSDPKISKRPENIIIQLVTRRTEIISAPLKLQNSVLKLERTVHVRELFGLPDIKVVNINLMHKAHLIRPWAGNMPQRNLKVPSCASTKDSRREECL
jgi:hypothetical protein